MADNITIVAEERKESGSTAARRLRREGILPCILVGSDGQVESIKINNHDFEVTLQRNGRENLLADMEVSGKTCKAMLKELQYDPISGRILHADFAEISMTEKMHVNIPIELVGDAPGVTAGGLLDQALREIEVECLPMDIVDSIRLSIEEVNIGDTLHVSDLDIPDTLTLFSELEASVVTIHAPRVADESEEGAAVEGGEGASAQPEVIGEKKDEDEEGGEKTSK